MVVPAAVSPHWRGTECARERWFRGERRSAPRFPGATTVIRDVACEPVVGTNSRAIHAIVAKGTFVAPNPLRTYSTWHSDLPGERQKCFRLRRSPSQAQSARCSIRLQRTEFVM